jgi:hypothetical protein
LRIGRGVSTLRLYDAAIYTADAVAHFRLDTASGPEAKFP